MKLQGGLLDVVLDPEFASNQSIYLSFAEPDVANGALSGTAVVQAQLSLSALTLKYRSFRLPPGI